MYASAGAGGDDDDGRRGGSGRKPKDEGHREPGKQRIVGKIGRNKLRVQETRDGVTKEWVEELSDSDGEEAALPEKQKPVFADWHMGGPVEVTIQQRRGRFNVEWVEKHEECSFGWAGDRYADPEAMERALDILRKTFSRMGEEKEMSMERSAATSNPSPGSSKNFHSGTSASHTGTSASGGTENTSECIFDLTGDLEAMQKALKRAGDILRNGSKMEAEQEMLMKRSAATSNPSPGSSKNIHSGTSAPHTGTSASGGTENTSEPSPTGNKDESNDSKEDDNGKEV